MAKRKRRTSRKLAPELMVDARELENVVFTCSGAKCRCRIELTPDDKLPEGAVCPCCGRSLDEERQLFKLYCDLYEAMFCPWGDVRFRIAPRGRFRARDDGRRRP